jgi:hypothetical protein
MNNSEKTYTRETIERRLAACVEDFSEELASLSSYSNRQRTPEEQFIYAKGVGAVLSTLAEQFEIAHHRVNVDELQAASGEAFRRSYPDRNQLKSRVLNNLLNQVRDLRIDANDNFKLLKYQETIVPLKRKVEKLSRSDKDSTDNFWTELAMVRLEVNCLKELDHRHLVNKSWFAEYFRRKTTQPSPSTINPQPSTLANAQP